VGIELDQRRGEEKLFAFLSRTPPDEGKLRRALTEALARARAERRGLAALEVPGLADHVSLWFRKP